MPELRNEVPSDDELAKYLEDSLKLSSLSLLADYRNNEDGYHLDHVQALAYLASLPISVDFLSVLKNSLFLALKRLNQLPRSDSFWANTNLRPTVFKLSEFCDRVLAEDPNDVQALLTLTAMIVFHTGDFKRGLWAELWALKAVSVEWIVFGAMFMEMCGADDAEEFAVFAVTNGVESLIVPHLRAVADNGGKLLSDWAVEVLERLATLQQ